VPKLLVPEKYRLAIAKLVQLTDEQTDAAIVALRAATKTDASVIAASLTLPIANAEDIIDATLSFYSVRAEWDVPLEQFIDDVTDAVRQSWDTAVAEDIEARFRARLTAVLTLPEVASLTKVTRVLSDYEHAFQSVKILTDLRPVFGESPEDGPIGMGIVHTLKIGYDGADLAYHEIFIALTSRDIEKVKSAIDRAAAATTILQQQLLNAGIRYLESD
jgi:hypothetical protein